MTKATKNCVLMIVLTISVCACNRDTLEKTPLEFIAYVENPENGLRREIVSGDFIYRFQYKPSEYIACKEATGGVIDTMAFWQRQDNLKNTAWFNVSVSTKKGGENPLKHKVSGLDEYNHRLAYFLSAASGNFRLKYGGREMKQAGYFFENNYGLTPMDVMIIGFHIDDPTPTEDLVLLYDDALFQSNGLRIRISTSEIKSIPKLVF